MNMINFILPILFRGFRTRTTTTLYIENSAATRSQILTRRSKKYIDQEPPYLMRQICVLQWEEIKTKNSGATHHC